MSKARARSSPNTTVAALLLRGAAFAAACTPYEGTLRFDATVDTRPPAPVLPTADAAPDAARPFVWCGGDFQRCHPLTHAGCSAGQRCVIEQLRPPLARCEMAVARPEGSLCGEGFGGCGDGLQCLIGRCLRPCCFDGSAGACGERSSCAVTTEATFIRACTIAGSCDYLSGRACPAGSGCAPASPFGEARCLQYGTAGQGRYCDLPNDCTAGHTCRAVRSGGESYCARVCNPETIQPPTCLCDRFSDRPVDFGACR